LSGWDELLIRIQPHDHLVQFYDRDEQLLVTKIGHYLYEGWKAGNALLVVGTATRNTAVCDQLSMLGMDPVGVINGGRLVFFDADEMVSRLLAPGQPEWSRFDALIGAAARDLIATHGGLRAYGEMVGILWSRGQCAAAVRIEEFWNRLMQSADMSLFCAYPIDVFSKEFDMQAVDAILCAHTHVLPTGKDGEIGKAIDHAMHDVLGGRAEKLKKLVKTYFRPSWAAVPQAEGLALWLRSNLPQYAGQILDRARQYYAAL
jgi:hypothetical protein